MNSRKKNAKQFRPREEYGSAKWGTDKDFEPYTDPVKWNNIPLTATEWLRMTRPEHPKYDRNKNILIVGGSGAGKTRGFVKTSLMQIPNGYQPKKNCCQTDGSFSFLASIQEVIKL